MPRKGISNEKEYTTTINLLIFLCLISVFILARIVYIYIADGNKLANSNLIENIEYEEINSLSNNIVSLTNELKGKYKIELYYGASSARAVEQVKATVLENSSDIYNMLIELKDDLALYPDSITSEIKEAGYNIVIYLVSSFKNDNIAVANRTSNGTFNIYISNSSKIKRAIYHETYHILEYYMKLKYNIEDVYKNWEENNPTGFVYEEDLDKLTAKYVYKVDKYNENAFVTLYSKYSEVEDRAETFAEMMSSMEKYSESEKTSKIIKKMESISEALEASFWSVRQTNSRYWERFNM